MRSVEELLGILCGTEGRGDNVLLSIYDIVDRWHSDGLFDRSDQILAAVQERGVEWNNNHYMVGLALLSITRPAKDELRERSKFFNFYRTLKSVEHKDLVGFA